MKNSSKEEILKNYREMVGDEMSFTRGYVIKRFNLCDIFISKEEKDIVLSAMNSNLKVLTIGLFSIVLSTISAIQPREEAR
jgi:hypothetical protein